MRLDLACDVRFPGFRLLGDLDLPLAGVTALFGPSGSGKSTLLRVIAGLERGNRGHVRMGGDTWQDAAGGVFVPPHRRRVGIVFQDARLFPHRTVHANLLYGRRRARAAPDVMSEEQVVRLLGIGQLLGRHVSRLSGGERQRVAIARAVLANPRLLLMDEPLSSLDERLREEALDLLERMAGELAVPIVYVTHSIEEVIRLASRLVLLEQGSIVASGSLEEISNRLDLRAYTGRLDAGSVLTTRVDGHDPACGLTTLGFDDVKLLVPLIEVSVGSTVHVRIRARDVALSLGAVSGTSFLNVIPAKVIEVADDPGPHAHVLLDAGQPLWARIMRRSIDDLGITPGKPIHALIKAVAVDRRSLGRPTAVDRALAGNRESRDG